MSDKKPNQPVSGERRFGFGFRFGNGTRNGLERRQDNSEWKALEKRQGGDQRSGTPRRRATVTQSPSDKVTKEPVQRDSDRDSLYILPLSILPIETPALSRSRLIKNARLDSVVEFFTDEQAGSGQMDIESLAVDFEWPNDPMHPDFDLLRKLERMPSYDVYSLRILLRGHGIPVNNIDSLSLSGTKINELNSYMTAFTRPLILNIYGGEDVSIQSLDDVIALFHDPDIKRAKEKLKVIADKLRIELKEVPRFLEDYSEIFLSLSYYRQSLDQIEPAISEFIVSMNEMGEYWKLRNDEHMMKTCTTMITAINGLMAVIIGRIENLDRSTKEMWNNISAKRFEKVKNLITGYHTTIGGVLCALSVKMDAWAQQFPDKDVGGPVERSQFVSSVMMKGIKNIQVTEDLAPMLTVSED